MAYRNVKINLSRPQKLKLAKGKTIRLSAVALQNGNDDVMVTTAQFKKMNKRALEGRGMDLQLNEEQIQGSGFFQSIGRAFKKVGHAVGQAGSYVGKHMLLPVVKSLGEKFMKDPVGTVEKGIQLAGMAGLGVKKPKRRMKYPKYESSILEDNFKPVSGGSFLAPGYKMKRGRGIIPPGGG